MDKMKLWVVGQYVDCKHCTDAWLFQGVFDDEQKAIDACLNEDYFVGPTLLNEELPSEPCEWKGAYYPSEQELK